jgi:hypothetical protein
LLLLLLASTIAAGGKKTLPACPLRSFPYSAFFCSTRNFQRLRTIAGNAGRRRTDQVIKFIHFT